MVPVFTPLTRQNDIVQSWCPWATRYVSQCYGSGDRQPLPAFGEVNPNCGKTLSTNSPSSSNKQVIWFIMCLTMTHLCPTRLGLRFQGCWHDTKTVNKGRVSYILWCWLLASPWLLSSSHYYLEIVGVQQTITDCVDAPYYAYLLYTICNYAYLLYTSVMILEF